MTDRHLPRTEIRHDPEVLPLPPTTPAGLQASYAALVSELWWGVVAVFTIFSSLIVLGTVLVLYKVVIAPRARLTAFNPRRAQTTARSGASGNALLMLAALNLASLAYDVISQGGRLHGELAIMGIEVLVPVFVVVMILLLVASRSVADAIIGATGLVAAGSNAYLQSGPRGMLVVLMLAMIVLFLLGVVRGFVRPS
jgi:hypothetical protein